MPAVNCVTSAPKGSPPSLSRSACPAPGSHPPPRSLVHARDDVGAQSGGPPDPLVMVQRAHTADKDTGADVASRSVPEGAGDGLESKDRCAAQPLPRQRAP